MVDRRIVVRTSAIIDPIARYSSRIVIYHFCLPHLHSTPPLGGPRRNITMAFGMEKLIGMDTAGKKMKICLFILTESTNVTDRRTDRQTKGRTPHGVIGRAFA